MVSYETIETEHWILTEEGSKVAATGSHESKVFAAIPKGGSLAISELHKQLGTIGKLGLGKAFQNKWIKKDGNDIVRTVRYGQY